MGTVKLENDTFHPYYLIPTPVAEFVIIGDKTYVLAVKLKNESNASIILYDVDADRNDYWTNLEPENQIQINIKLGSIRL